MKVGFVGAGKMGLPIVWNIARKTGNPVIIVDPQQPSFTEDLSAEAHLLQFTTNAEELAVCDIVVLCLPDSKVVSAVVEGGKDRRGLFDILNSGATILDCSSSIPAETLRLATLLSKRGIAFHDAPVSGGLARAWKSELTVMVGGVNASSSLTEIIETFAVKIVHLERVGDGHVMKTANNYLLAANIISFVEALHFARHAGISFAKFGEVVNSSSGGSYVSLNKISTIERNDDSVSFTTALIAKDVHNFLDSCAEIDLKLPMCSRVAELWDETVNKVGANVDSMKIYRTLGNSVN